MYAIGCAQWFADWVVGFRERAPMNAFHLPDSEQHRIVGGDPDIRIWLGLWEIAEDEALVIDLVPPACDYWNFQLGNIWAESLDYRFRNVHVNSGGAVYHDDGSVRLVVAHRDPGVPNWIDAAGLPTGMIFWRFLLPEEEVPPIETEVVDVGALG